MTREYCERCAAPIVVREVEGRARDVCSRCGMVFYENPLPVAAAVVLDDARNVLLIRRGQPPHRGEWCLPTGFAETGEAIEAAALRELREETGIEGSILRLLTARSLSSDYYGDLLFVCFEVERTGGVAAAGDDADALGWFPLDGLPALAFESHTEAVRVCESLHAEPWAIQDSFVRLYSDDPEGMLSDALVALVEEHAERICDGWMEAIRDNQTTSGYRRVDLADVRGATLEALSHFCAWLREPAAGEMEEFYLEVGRRRRGQGLELAEVLSALALLRKEIWTFARLHQVLASPLDVYRVMELSRRIVLFFDKALYHAARGYAEEPGPARAAPIGE